MNMKIYLGFLCAVIFSVGCQPLSKTQIPSSQARNDIAAEIARNSGLSLKALNTKKFTILSYQPPSIDSDVLTIYIEGDGLGWIGSQVPSDDPTPINPIALRLAAIDDGGARAYLARPCQYQKKSPVQSECSEKYWTNGRFSEDVIDSMNQAIDQLKSVLDAKKVILIGYSGGAAVAILCAARRGDVVKIVTVAGNIQTHLWTSKMGLQNLSESLDPVDFASQISKIPQWHFIGENDLVIPLELSESYSEHFAEDAPIRFISIKGYGHQCCWAENWRALMRVYE